MTPSGPGQAPPFPDREAVLAALDRVIDPRSGRGLAAAGLVRGLSLRPGRAAFMLEVAVADVPLYGPVREAAEAALASAPGVRAASVVLTSEGAPAVPPRRPTAASAANVPARPAHVRQVIAVASGKGGVGKSTVAVNLACAFAALGYSTGLLDADVYGPSVHRMLGLTQRPEVDADKRLIPLDAFGLKAVSVGLLVEESQAVIWRGPMASSAVSQFLNEVRWGTAEAPLDLLIIDMPPGTGDVQLTISQKVALDGAVVVSTPQEVALIDVRRGAAMFARTATPVLGVIENMAYFPDPAGGAPIEIFGRGGAKAMAEEVGAPFLGEIPIDIALRRSGDAGAPITAVEPTSPSARVFLAIAEILAERLKDPALRKPPPRIVVGD